jgi:MFS family permease
VVSAPDVEHRLDLDHGGYALAVFALPLLLSSIFEACVALLTHQLSRSRILNVAQWALSVSLAACAGAPSALTLGLGLAFAGAASGAACAAAESELVTNNRDRLDQTMARWMLFGGIGDVLSPALVAAVLALGGSYRGAFTAVSALIAVQALRFSLEQPRASQAPDEDDEPSVTLRQALAQSLSDKRLWMWVTGAALCTLLDELVVALAALRLRGELGATQAEATLCVSVFSMGVVVGAFGTERAVARWSWRPVLSASAGACGVVLVGVVATQSVLHMTLGLFVLGACAAAHYPLLLARAYEAAPGRAAIVNAMGEFFVVLDLLVPPLLGAIADRWGLAVAMSCLLVQPAGVLAVVAFALRTARR